MRVVLIFLLATLQAASSALVPAKQLYEDFEEIKSLKCTEEDESDKCARLAVIRTDFDCRYGHGGSCYCCGAIYTYIEQGEICTRYCYTSQNIIPKYGNYPAIILPFNWGDNAKPRSAALANGQSFPIIPVNARLSRKVYGIDTFEEEKPAIFALSNINTELGGSVQYLADVMLRSLKSSQKNIMFSPLSLNSVLSLLLLGAKRDSDTEIELRDILGKIVNPVALKNMNREILNHLDSLDGVKYQNNVLMSDRLTADTNFVEESFNFFQADTSYFNTSDLQSSVREINKQISLRTNGLIPEAVKSLEDTDMMLINSLVIELPWFPQFERRTKALTFTRTDGSKLKVPAMTTTSRNIKMSQIRVGRTKLTEMRLIRVPYATREGDQNTVEMRIYLGPRQVLHSGLEILLDTDQNVDNIFQMSPPEEEEDKEITLVLPIFTSKSELDVAALLKKHGIQKIFSSEAELTKFTMDEENFSVKNINQEVFVKVSEEGTTAAAITRVNLALLSAETPQVVTVNVPFIFSIWDNVNNLPLIVGLINDPTK